MTIADRAIAAYEAEQQAKRLEQKAETERARAQAQDFILRKAEEIGLFVSLADVVPSFGKDWKAVIAVDDDADLQFTCDPSVPETGKKVVMRVRVCDQLYWDLPPDQEVRGKGGSYGCYGLQGIHDKKVETLADLGGVLARVREARERWRRKHASQL